MKSRKITNLFLGVIILISVVGMIYFGMQKEGYHIDELYSYGLSNSEYLPFMHFGEHDYNVKEWMKEYGAGESFADLFRNLWKDFLILKEYDFDFYNTPIYQAYQTAQANSADTRTTTWVSGQAYRDYLGVSETNTFNYASVYYNQRGDVHPPFFYMLLHTICSVFQGSFSKWYGLGLNIAVLIAAMLVLYHVTKKFTGNEVLALLTTAVYGFSNGFFTTAMYIRMYALMTLLVLLFFYVHLLIFENGYALKKKTLAALMITTLLGYMTHYYFVLYAMGMAVIFSIWMCLQKKWKPLMQYILLLAGSAAIGLCIWPFAIKHVFLGYRGQESLNVFRVGEFHWIKVKLMLYQIITQLFGMEWWIPISLAIVLCVAAVIYRKKTGLFEKGTMLVLPIMFYIVFTAQIVPFYVERYVMCTYPFWCIFAVVGVWAVAKLIFQLMVMIKQDFAVNKQHIICYGLAGICVAFLFIMNNGFVRWPGYLSIGGQETYTVPEQTHCVYVISDGTWNESAQDTLLLSRCEQVAVTYESNLPLLENTYQYEENDCVMVVIRKDLEIEKVLQKVIDTLGISYMQEAFREESSNTIRVYFNI